MSCALLVSSKIKLGSPPGGMFGSAGVPTRLAGYTGDGSRADSGKQLPHSLTLWCSRGVQRTVRCCAWDRHGKYLALASFDGTTSIWSLVGAEWECVSTLEGHENEVKSVAWSPVSDMLATCGRDKTVWIWCVGATRSNRASFCFFVCGN
jgi:WD40 repeat protein